MNLMLLKFGIFKLKKCFLLFASLAQLEEAVGLEPIQCEFKSHMRY